MRTKILISTVIFAVSAYSFAASTNDDHLAMVNEVQNVSLAESLTLSAKGRNLHASNDFVSSQSVSKRSASLATPSFLENKKGRNLDLQSIALKKFMDTYEMQVVDQVF